MSAHKLLSRLFLLCGTLLLIAIQLRPTTLAFAQQTDSSQCVQVFEQWEVSNDNVFQFDVNARRFERLDEPVVPPFSIVSPDGRYAAFLKLFDKSENWVNQEIGLYVGPVDGKQSPFLAQIYKSPRMEGYDTVEHYVQWSPDSSTLAYIEVEDGQFYVATVDVTGSHKKRYSVPIPPGYTSLMDTYLSGWSADSQYIAIIRQPLLPSEQYTVTVYATVLGAATLSPVDIGLINHFAFGYGRADVSWMPKGHQLAAILDDADNTLFIWSPERQIEAKLPVALRGNYYDLYWSPDSRHIQVVSSTGHGSVDILVGYDSIKLIPANSSADFSGLVGWTVDNSAVIVDFFLDATTDLLYRQFVLVDLVKHKRETIDAGLTSFSQAAISQDRKKMVYLLQVNGDYIVKLIDFTTGEKRTLFQDINPPDEPWEGATIDRVLSYPTLFWSPDGEFIVHEWWNSKKEPVIHLLDDSVNPIHRAKFLSKTFVWIEHNWLAYVDYADNTGHTWLRNLTTGETTLLDAYVGEYRAWYSEVALSPDRSIVALFSTDGVVLTSLDSTEHWQRKIPSDNPWGDSLLNFSRYWNPGDRDISFSRYRLAWSLTGDKLAFVASTDEKPIFAVVSRTGEVIFTIEIPTSAYRKYRSYYLVTWGCNHRQVAEF